MNKHVALAGAIIMSLGLAACGGHGTQNLPAATQSAGTGVLRPLDVTGGIGPSSYTTTMGDAAPWFSGRTLSHFYLGVREVDVLLNGQIIPIAQSGSSPYTMDLLAYQNGNALQLVQASLSPASYTGMRFVLAPSASSAVFTDGTTLPVTFVTNNGNGNGGPGGSTVTTTDPNMADAIDVTISGSFPLASDSPSTFNIDFNALESMSLSNNTVRVRPALIAAAGTAQASVSGTIVNQTGSPVQNVVVAAVAADGSIANTALTGPHGLFNVHALNPGTYTLRIFNSYTTVSGQQYAASGQTSTATSFNGPTVNVGAGSAVAVGTLGD